MNERPIPAAAQRDKNSVELARIWIAEGKLNCSIKIGMYNDMGKDEPFAWGIILADVAKHISDAMMLRFNVEHEDTLDIIFSSFKGEMEKSTSKADGAFKINQ
jgi:hypothetical protein